MAEKKNTSGGGKLPCAVNSPERKTKDTKGKKLLAEKRKRALEKKRRQKKAGLIAIALAIVIFAAVFLEMSQEAFSDSDKSKYTVVIDAGHGFDDPGCDSPLLKGDEKKTTLEIARVLSKKLEKKGIRVIMTHNGKSYPSEKEIRILAKENNIDYSEDYITDNNVFSAYERAVYVAAKSRKEKTDLLISLHVNSIENKPDISQYEIYYYKDGSSAEKTGELCEIFSQAMDNRTVIKATEYKDTFVITRFGDYPSLLFEMGYCTNEKDASNLNSALWRNRFCEKIADGIEQWLSSEEAEDV